MDPIIYYFLYVCSSIQSFIFNLRKKRTMQSSAHLNALEEQSALGDFKEAVERLNSGAPSKPIPETAQRKLYGLFERVVKGDPPSDPSDDERTKAWQETRGLSRLEAMLEYVEICERFVPEQVDRSVEELPDDVKNQLKQHLDGKAAAPAAEKPSDVFEAIRAGAAEYASFFPECLNSKDDVCGATPLMIATDAEREDVVDAILAYGEAVDVDAVDEDGCTALHYAATVNNPSIAKALLRAGANPLIKDLNGMDVGETASDCRSLDVVKVLDARTFKKDAA